MEQNNQGYKSMDVSFQQEELDCMLGTKLMHYGNNSGARWEFSIFNTANMAHIYHGNLQETIELILLGKVLKEQIKSADKPASCTS